MLSASTISRNVTVEATQRANSQLVSDETAGFWREAALPENAFELCADLARRYGPKLGIRTLDSCTSPAPSNSRQNNSGPSMSARQN